MQREEGMCSDLCEAGRERGSTRTGHMASGKHTHMAHVQHTHMAHYQHTHMARSWPVAISAQAHGRRVTDPGMCINPVP